MLLAELLRKIVYILLIILLGCPTLTHAHTSISLTPEQEQQFLYYFYEAERLVNIGELQQAWEVLQFCYELNPNDATVNNYMGRFLEAMHRDAEALPYLEKAFRLAPDNYWYNYTLKLLQTNHKGTQKIAVTLLEDVAQRNKQDAEIRDMLQRAYGALGEYKKALVVQDEIDSIVGYNNVSAMQRYRFNVLLHNTKQAIHEVERYLETSPDDYQFLVFRLQLYEQTRQPSDKMIVAYEAVLRLDPRNLMLMNNLAWNLCISNKDLERAEQLSRVTIMKEPTNPVYLDTYAWILYKQGEYETALFYIQRALEHIDQGTKKEILSHYKAIRKKQKK